MNRRLVLITAATSLVLLAAWFFALWQPKGSELAEERERLSLASSEVSQLETRILRLQASQAEGPQLAARLDRLRSAVPDDPSLPQFILDANDAATTAGVAFVSISPQEPVPSSTAGLPPQIALNVEIEGGYFQVLDFVERITDLQRVVVLDGVQVAPKGDQDGPPELAVSLTGRMFTTQLPAVPVPAEAAAAPVAAATPASTTTTVVPS